MLSQTSEYALRAVIYLAQRDAHEPAKLGEIANALGAPRNYLSKTLHLLARAGVLESGRGPLGGFRLAVPPDRLTLAEAVAPFEPPGILARRCLLGHGDCSDLTPCAAHATWKPVAAPMRTFFRETTVAQLLAGNAVIPPAATPDDVRR